MGEGLVGLLGCCTIWVAPGFGVVELCVGCDNWVFGGFGGSSSPQFTANRGYFLLIFLADPGEDSSASSPTSLLFAGDLATPLLRLGVSMISCALLDVALSTAHSCISCSPSLFPPPPSPELSGLVLAVLSSSPIVSLLIAQRLNSTMLSPS